MGVRRSGGDPPSHGRKAPQWDPSHPVTPDVTPAMQRSVLIVAEPLYWPERATAGSLSAPPMTQKQGQISRQALDGLAAKAGQEKQKKKPWIQPQDDRRTRYPY